MQEQRLLLVTSPNGKTTLSKHSHFGSVDSRLRNYSTRDFTFISSFNDFKCTDATLQIQLMIFFNIQLNQDLTKIDNVALQLKSGLLKNRFCEDQQDQALIGSLMS